MTVADARRRREGRIEVYTDAGDKTELRRRANSSGLSVSDTVRAMVALYLSDEQLRHRVDATARTIRIADLESRQHEEATG